MSFTSLMQDDWTVYRTGQGYYDERRRYVEPTETEVVIKATVYPFMRGDNQIVMDAGDRSSGAYVMLTKSPLVKVSEDKKTIADEIEIDGIRYYCKELKDYNLNTLSGAAMSLGHYKGIFYKKDNI